MDIMEPERELMLSPFPGALKRDQVANSDIEVRKQSFSEEVIEKQWPGAVTEFGSKSIGFWGGVMLLINNVAGPTVSLMPGLAQKAGWLAMLLVMLGVAALSAGCGLLLVEAVQRMPENEDFSRRIEFSDLIRHYFPFPLDHAMMLIYHVYLMLTLMTYIIQSGQVVDYVILDSFGCAPGVRLSVDWDSHLVCGTHRDSVTPFGEEAILSSSMCIIVLVCIPLAMKNLDDNIILQWAAIVGLSVMAAYWAVFMTSQPNFPHALPAVTSSQTSLVGTVLFNFAFMSALPSWLNEKRPEVPVARSFVVALGYVVAVYTALGVLGGMAFAPLYNSGQNLFSKLNESGSVVAQSSVALYPILQNFTSIPVLAIFIRYNLQASGLSRGLATFVAFGVPWLLSVPFYTGRGLDAIAETGGLATSSVINFLVPCAAALRAWLAKPREKICEI